MAVWSFSPDDTLAAIDTTRNGLDEKEVIERRKRYGDNALPRAHKLDALTILLRQFSSPLIFILVAAAGLTIFLQEWLETGVILLAVFVNAGLGFYQEFSAENVLEKITTYVKERARVVREGIEQEIDSSLLVPGDIIELSLGSRVPADARIISENALSADESILTGESLPVKKQIDALSEGTLLPERTNMLFAGTLVVEGNATAVVSATNASTEIGHIADLVAKSGFEPTPLQRALAQLAWFIFIAIAAIVVVIFVLGVLRGEPLFEMILISVAIAVGAIPEALPIALTVILAIGLQRLAAKNGIMRSLSAAETLGSATVVMTDKTGTLTQAVMRLTGIYTIEEMTQAERSHRGLGDLTTHERTVLETALTGTTTVVENPKDKPADWTFIGSPIETAMLRAAAERGVDVAPYAHVRRPPLLAFNSTNKFSISAHYEKDLYVALGAPDVLLRRSKISKEEYVAIEKTFLDIAAEGKRLVGVARFPKNASKKFAKGVATEEDAENLEFLGILVFEDPVRSEAKAAIEKIESLGAFVVMVTGDLKGTAISVGKHLGWELNEGQVLSGEELRRLSDEELLSNLKNIRIFARVTPEDKLRIGSLYKKLGEVVAMTGDGVNDAPSLKAVDIGVAIGSGSDVAKASADLVLLDDNFKTIVAAIEEGRRMLDNIRKTTVYLLSTSLDEVFLIGGALVVGLPLPLTALQIIWINLFTESLPALAYAFDRHYDVKHGSRTSVGSIFNREVKILTVGIGTATSFLLFGLYWFLLKEGFALEDVRSTIFICLASYILFVAFSFRSLHQSIFSYDIFANRVLNWSVFGAAIFVIATISIPFTQNIFGVSIPPMPLLSLIGAWLVANLVVIEVAKWFFRRFLHDA